MTYENEHAGHNQTSSGSANTGIFGTGGADIEHQLMVESYISRFSGDFAKEQEFLGLVAWEMETGSQVGDLLLNELFRQVMYAGIQPSTPVGSASAGALGMAAPSSRPAPMGMSAASYSVQADASIVNPKFLSGFSGTNEIYDMQPGFIRSRFIVANNSYTAKPITAIVKLMDLSNNVMADVAVVEKTLAPYASETITAGFNVPGTGHEIVIELWDDSMNLYEKTVFPNDAVIEDKGPHAEITVNDGNWPLQGYVLSDGVFTLEYNGRVEEHESGSSYAYIYIDTETEPITTPVILKGEGISYIDFDFNCIKTFKAKGLIGLKSISMNYNSLEELSIEGSPLLWSLYLTHNNMSSFRTNEYYNLEYLNLMCNSLTEFDGKSLPSLDTLVLSYNQLESLDGSGLESLRKLEVGNNEGLAELYLPQYPKAPGGNEGFYMLSCGETALSEMPPESDMWGGIIDSLPDRSDADWGHIYGVYGIQPGSAAHQMLGEKNWLY
jgi:hypothetical protein